MSNDFRRFTEEELADYDFGDPAITRWALAGLLCSVGGLLFFFTGAVAYDVLAPIFLPTVLGLLLAGLLISLVTYTRRSKADKPDRVYFYGLTTFILVGAAATFAFFIWIAVISQANFIVAGLILSATPPNRYTKLMNEQPTTLRHQPKAAPADVPKDAALEAAGQPLEVA